ncbi:MAG: DNA polymerase I [Proteobacteria bacterium]|nr:DNA polymerase I [Pseudomonadota bacterium]
MDKTGNGRTLYLIDGYNFVFRAFHSLPPLSRPDGKPIGAVYGFSNMLFKFLQEHGHQSDDNKLFLVIFDSGRKNIRHEMYHEYKANRPTPPDELIFQFPIVRQAVDAFNVHMLDAPEGYEADDVIASYAKAAAVAGYEVIVVSGDKDLMQLVNQDIHMYDSMRDKMVDAAAVIDKFGVKPEQVVDYLALVGDSSDNVPGVDGIGPKTAAELLSAYGSLDGIYAKLAAMPESKKKQTISEQKDRAYLSKQLVELYDLKELPIPLPKLKPKPVDFAKLSIFLKEQGFKSLLDRASKAFPSLSLAHTENKEEGKALNIEKLNKLEELNIAKFAHEDICAIYVNGEQASIASANHAIQLDISKSNHMDLFDSGHSPTLQRFWETIKPLLESSSVRKIMLSVKPVYKELAALKVTLTSYDDLQVMAYTLSAGRHNGELQTLMQFYLEDSDLQQPEDARLLMQLYKSIKAKLIAQRCMTLYEKLDRPLIGVLAAMELKGVHIDVRYLANLSNELTSRQDELQKQIWRLCGEEFNIGSPKQLAEVLYEKLALQVSKKRAKGKQLSTDAEALEDLAEQGHEVAEKILQWRQLSKLLGTYINPLPKCVNPATGRVHTTYNATLTSTARLSSTNPNLQNIPIRTEEGHKIRGAFTAEEGKMLISADYSQIELRLLAHIADIKPLQEALTHGVDLHALTASQIFQVPLDKVSSELRRQAKTINFGIIYGISAFGLAHRLGISRPEAQLCIDNYFREYPGIKEYMDECIHYARTNGYVKTIWGRQCYIEGINDKVPSRRGFAERAAINAPLQGTASDIIRKAMVEMPEGVARHMILQIHDELLFEVPAGEVEHCSATIKQVMEGVAQLKVPMEVSVTHGKSWMKG